MSITCIQPSSFSSIARETIRITEHAGSILLPVAHDEIVDTYREGSHLVVVLAAGAEILIEDFFIRLEKYGNFTFLTGDSNDGRLTTLRIDSDGEIVDSEPTALGRLEEMFGGQSGDHSIQVPSGESAAIFGLEEWSTSSILLAGGGLLLGGYLIGDSGGDNSSSPAPTVSPNVDLNNDGTEDIYFAGNTSDRDGNNIPDMLDDILPSGTGTTPIPLTFDVDGDLTPETYADAEALVQAVRRHSSGAPQLEYDVDGNGMPESYQNVESLVLAVQRQGGTSVQLEFDVNGDNTTETYATVELLVEAVRQFEAGRPPEPLVYDVDGDGTIEEYEDAEVLVAAVRLDELAKAGGGTPRPRPLIYDVDGDGSLESFLNIDAFVEAVRRVESGGGTPEPQPLEYDLNGDSTPERFSSVDALVTAVRLSGANIDLNGDSTADVYFPEGGADLNENSIPDMLELIWPSDGTATLVDTNSDSTADRVQIDRDLDGTADEIRYDTDNSGTFERVDIDDEDNGTVDRIAYDADESGTVERVEYDRNEDGNIDETQHDADENGTPERFDIDVDYDGTVNYVAYDKDENGSVERIVHDGDENGTADRTEFDRNGDGTIDETQFDANENGTTERTAFDADYNGTVDRIEYDADESGVAERTGFDRNNDNTIEETQYDADENGMAERTDFDRNSDGTHDEAQYDADENGTAERTVLDTDFNGTNDCFEFDTDENGEADRILRDTNEDGMPDLDVYHVVQGTAVVTRSDRNYDGTFDLTEHDSDGDGTSERTEFDSDHDGTVNRIEIDSNDDGTVGQYAHDADANGTLDFFEYDRDGDGTVDLTGYDDDEDGIRNLYEADTDNNGTVEWRFYNSDDDDLGAIDPYDDGSGSRVFKFERLEGDINEDGIVDNLRLDIDDNGTFDLLATDMNGDGTIDTAVYHHNSGVFDPFDFTSYPVTEADAHFVVDQVLAFDSRGRSLLRAVDNSFDTTTETGLEGEMVRVKVPVYGTDDGVLFVDGTFDEGRVYHYHFADPVAYDGPALIEIYQRDGDLGDEAVDAILAGGGTLANPAISGLISSIREVDADGDGTSDLRGILTSIAAIPDPQDSAMGIDEPVDWYVEEFEYRKFPDQASQVPYRTLRVVPDESSEVLYSEELYYERVVVNPLDPAEDQVTARLLRSSFVKSSNARFAVPEFVDSDGTTDGTTNELSASFFYHSGGTEEGLMSRIEYGYFDSLAENAEPVSAWRENFEYTFSTSDGITSLDAIRKSVFQVEEGPIARLDYAELHHFNEGSVDRVDIDSVGTDGSGSADGTYDSEETLFYDPRQRVVFRVVDEHVGGTAYDGTADRLEFIDGLSYSFVPNDEILDALAGIRRIELAGDNASSTFPALTGEDFNGATMIAISDAMLTTLAAGGSSYTLTIDGDTNDTVLLRDISRISSGPGTMDADGRAGYQGTDGIIYIDPDVVVEDT